MSIDLVHPPPNASPETALRISQLAPRFVKRSAKPAPFPLSLFTPDETTETWASYETLFMECLRTGDDRSAKQILDKLLLRFGDKNERVVALQGMWEEAMAQGDKGLIEVLKIYAEILENNPSNIVSDEVMVSVCAIGLTGYSPYKNDGYLFSSQWERYKMLSRSSSSS